MEPEYFYSARCRLASAGSDSPRHRVHARLQLSLNSPLCPQQELGSNRPCTFARRLAKRETPPTIIHRIHCYRRLIGRKWKVFESLLAYLKSCHSRGATAVPEISRKFKSKCSPRCAMRLSSPLHISRSETSPAGLHFRRTALARFYRARVNVKSIAYRAAGTHH